MSKLQFKHKPKPKKERKLKHDTEESVVQKADKEVKTVLRQFDEQKSQKHINEYRDNVMDSEYWVAICFMNRAQKEEWLKKSGLLPLGDKYIDGIAASKVMGIELENKVPKIKAQKNFGKDVLELVKK